MTSQPPPDDPYYPTVEPQPLKFSPVPDGGVAATFEALVPGPGEPGAPAVTLAVTVDASVPRDSGEQLSELLGQMRAAFDVLPDLPPGWDVPGDGDGDGKEPVDLKKEMQVELRLVWPDPGEPVAVVVTVGTTTGIVPAPREPQIVRDLGVTQRYDDYWSAINPSSPPTAKVHVRGGQGTMRRTGSRHQTDVHIPPPDHFSLPNATAFILHAVRGAMDYTLNSGFFSPQHPNNR